MTVLVVDDEQTVRALVTHSISAAGYYVLEAGTSAEAMQLARVFPGPIHLAVVDQTLESATSGIFLAAELARVHPGIRLLLISGNLEGQVTVGLPEKTVPMEFLQKPFTPAALLEKIRRMLAHYNAGWST